MLGKEKEIKKIKYSVYFWMFALPALFLMSCLVAVVILINKKFVISVNGSVFIIIHNGKGFGMVVSVYYLFPLLVCYQYFATRQNTTFSYSVEEHNLLEARYKFHCLIFGIVYCLPLIIFIIRRWLKKGK